MISVGIEVLTDSMLWLFLLLMLGGVLPKLVVREQEVASITMDRLRAEADLVASSRTLELSTNIRSCTMPQIRSSRTFSLLKALNSAFTIKNLLRHYYVKQAKQVFKHDKEIHNWVADAKIITDS